MIRQVYCGVAVASLLTLHTTFPAAADDGASKINVVNCSGFDDSLSPIQFDLELHRNANEHAIAFHEDQSSGLFGAVESLERIAQSNGSEKDEYFVVDGGQKLRLSLEEEDGDHLTVLVRGTHPSDDPTFLAITRCERISEQPKSTGSIIAGQGDPADRQPGRLIRVSSRIAFECALLSSPDQRSTLNLLPDGGNSFLDKAEYGVSGSIQVGTASVMGETLDGVQTFRAIISMSDGHLIFATNGKTGWVRTITKSSTDSAPDYGVCRNSDSASERSAQ